MRYDTRLYQNRSIYLPLMTHVGRVLQLPLAWHVTNAFPFNVYPSSHDIIAISLYVVPFGVSADFPFGIEGTEQSEERKAT